MIEHEFPSDNVTSPQKKEKKRRPFGRFALIMGMAVAILAPANDSNPQPRLHNPNNHLRWIDQPGINDGSWENPYLPPFAGQQAQASEAAPSENVVLESTPAPTNAAEPATSVSEPKELAVPEQEAQPLLADWEFQYVTAEEFAQIKEQHDHVAYTLYIVDQDRSLIEAEAAELEESFDEVQDFIAAWLDFMATQPDFSTINAESLPTEITELARFGNIIPGVAEYFFLSFHFNERARVLVRLSSSNPNDVVFTVFVEGEEGGINLAFDNATTIPRVTDINASNDDYFLVGNDGELICVARLDQPNVRVNEVTGFIRQVLDEHDPHYIIVGQFAVDTEDPLYQVVASDQVFRPLLDAVLNNQTLNQ